MKDIMIHLEKPEAADRPKIEEIKRELLPIDDGSGRIFIGLGGAGKRSAPLPESRVRGINEHGTTVIMHRGEEFEDRIVVLMDKKDLLPQDSDA